MTDHRSTEMSGSAPSLPADAWPTRPIEPGRLAQVFSFANPIAEAQEWIADHLLSDIQWSWSPAASAQELDRGARIMWALLDLLAVDTPVAVALDAAIIEALMRERAAERTTQATTEETP